MATFAGNSILTRGLVLISVPLLFELGFALTLYYLQQDYENKLQAQVRANQVVLHTNELWLGVMDLTTGLLATKIFPDTRFHSRFPIGKIDQEYQALAVLLKDDPKQLELASDIRRLCVTLEKETSGFENPVESEEGLVGVRGQIESWRRYKQILVRIGDNMMFFRKTWLDRVKEYSQASAEYPKLISQVTFGGVALSVFIAGALFAYFIGRIYQGISLMMENTRRFAAQEPLKPPSKGKDELATLDRAFHQMSSAVQAAAEEKEKLQLLRRDFYNMVTHDMRTPLASVALSIESLTGGIVGDLPEAAMPSLKRAESNVHLLMKLINDLLDLEAASAGAIKLQIDSFDAKEAMEEVVTLLKPLADSASVELRVNCLREKIQADRYHFVRILNNLVSNAIKFSPRGKPVELTLTKQPKRILVEVVDKGRGISEEELSKIFQKFGQVEIDDARLKGGSGLGLTVAKCFVEAHGGAIGVESKSGEGSRFWFWLPSDEG